jgi:hypothetical protein
MQKTLTVTYLHIPQLPFRAATDWSTAKQNMVSQEIRTERQGNCKVQGRQTDGQTRKERREYKYKGKDDKACMDQVI